MCFSYNQQDIFSVLWTMFITKKSAASGVLKSERRDVKAKDCRSHHKDQRWRTVVYHRTYRWIYKFVGCLKGWVQPFPAVSTSAILQNTQFFDVAGECSRKFAKLNTNNRLQFLLRQLRSVNWLSNCVCFLMTTAIQLSRLPLRCGCFPDRPHCTESFRQTLFRAAR